MDHNGPETIARRVIGQGKSWTGKWCWTGHASHPWNQYAYFRKVFDVANDVTRAVARVSADALYTLYVNGQRVHHGPARAYPSRYSFDTLDLTDLIRPGRNVIGAVVHQYGAPTFIRVFRDASGFLVDGVVESDGAAISLHTPDGWLMRPAEGWRKNVARVSIQMGFQEHFDADADRPDWLSAEFEPDESWKSPWGIGPVGTHPWLLLEPRGIPLLADHVESPTAVVATFRGENPRGYKVAPDVYHLVNPAGLRKDGEAITDAPAMLADDESVTTVAPPPEGEFVAATIDLGTYRTGHIVIDIADAAGDEFVDVLMCETIEKTQLPLILTEGTGSREAQAVRYRCRPGAQRWESFHYCGMRYLLVVFRNVESGPLKVRRIAVRQVHAGFDEAGAFSCSDELLNKVWEVGRNTQLNCSFDAFVDCPWREMAMWWGDARVQSKVAAFAYGDTTLLERGIGLIAQSQATDGSLHSHAPADIPRHRLPDFMLTWVGTVWDHYQFTGRVDVIKACLPTLRRVFDFFEAHESDEGLIGWFDGYWMFLDWVTVFKKSWSGPFNLMYLQALRWAVELCKLAGESAAVFERKAAKTQAAVEKYFWNDRTGQWRDGWDAEKNEPVEEVSQHSNTLAILAGLKPETHDRLAREVLLKSAKAKRSKVVTASPFFYAYVMEAMARHGLSADVIGLIRDKWGALVTAGATTFPEMWTVTVESRCHAWSSSPVYHLMEIVLGVRRVEPGWKRARIAPTPETLEHARGTVPTPLGSIRVEWEKGGEDQLAVRVDLPEGIAGVFVSPDGTETELQAGLNEFHT